MNFAGGGAEFQGTSPTTLLQNLILAGGNWTTGGYTITTTNVTNNIAITLLTGNLFFRLSSP